jgi:hypothetical protein
VKLALRMIPTPGPTPGPLRVETRLWWLSHCVYGVYGSQGTTERDFMPRDPGQVVIVELCSDIYSRG